MITKQWLKAAGIRAFKTMAQAAVAAIGTASLISDVDWFQIGSTALMAAVFSLLTSCGGLPEVAEVEEDDSTED